MLRRLCPMCVTIRSLSTHIAVHRPQVKEDSRLKTMVQTTRRPIPNRVMVDPGKVNGYKVNSNQRYNNGFKREENDFLHSLVKSSDTSFICSGDPNEFDKEMNNWINSSDLNDQCNLTKALEALDTIYMSKIIGSKFINSLRTKLFQQLDNVDTDTVFKKLLFTIILSRRKLTTVEQRQIETRIMNHLPSMSLNEVSLVTSAFFKTETTITDPRIIELIVDKMKADLANKESSVHNIAYSSIFKCLRHSFSNENAQTVRMLIQSIDANMLASGTLDRFNVTSLVHLNHLSSQYLQPNVTISRLLIQRCVQNDRAQLKDITHALRVAFDFHVDVPNDVIDTFIKRVANQPEVYSRHLYLFHFLGFLNLIVPRKKKLTTELEQLINGAKQLKNNGNWLKLAHGAVGSDIDLGHQWLQLHTLIELCWPRLGPLLTMGEVNQLSSRSVKYHDPLKSDMNNCSSFDYSYNLLYQGLLYVTKPPYQVVSKRILPESAFPELIIPLSDKSRTQLTNNNNGYNLNRFRFRDCLLINLKHRQHFSDANDTILRSYYLIRFKLFKLLGFHVLDIHWMDVAGESPKFIGSKVRKMVEEGIEKGSIDPMFKVLLTK